MTLIPHSISRFAKGMIIFLGILLGDVALAKSEIHVCDDINEFPPYAFERHDQKGKYVGISIEIIEDILRRSGYVPKITLLPWLRCLREVNLGRKFAIAMDATSNEERKKNYFLSKPIYVIHSLFYYDTKKFPEPPRVTTLSDMQRYKYCGIFGFNYSMYETPAANIDSGAKTEQARFQKLRSGHCDFVIADVEPLRGLTNEQRIDLQGLKTIPIPEFKDKEYYFLISKGPAGGRQLLKQVNDGLDQMKADGSYQKIMRKYDL